MSRRATRCVCAGLAAAALACGGGLAAPRPESAPAEDAAQLRAGVAEVDITPPVGLGLFGHGPESRIATGTQLRLRCQVFLLEGPGAAPDRGEAVALVPCDLASPSLLLQRTIAQRARARGVRVGANRILLLATHTHMAPGHYFPTGSYSGPFSSRLVGFDERVLNFLAERVAQGLLEAQRDLRPAKVAWHQAEVSRVLARNRSLAALLRNRALPERLLARLHDDPERPAEQTTDPTLSVLRIDQQDAFGYTPRGVFAVFGVHPTALLNDTPFYSGDLFGYATRAVGQRLLREHGVRVVAGIANGIEGDSTPARAMPGARESYRLGQLLADEIVRGFGAAGEALEEGGGAAALRVAYRELDFESARVSVPDAQGFGLCEHPLLGTASGGGVADQPTLLRFFPQYNAGVHLLDPQPCHGRKLPIQMLDGDSIAGVDFPRFGPIAIVELGGHALVTLPAELTTVAGMRVRDAVADALGRPPAGAAQAARGVVLVGLANEYLQYVTTADEYEAQAYEGASNLYGPQSAQFLADQAGCLARALHAPEALAACSYGQLAAVDALQPIEFPAPEPHAHMTADGDEVAVVRTLSAPRLCPTQDGLLAFCVEFDGPQHERVRRRESLWLQARKRLPDGSVAVVDDDRGTSLWTRYDHDTGRWTATFVPALAGAGCGTFTIVLGGERWGDDDYTIASEPFTVDCSAPRTQLEVSP